MKSYFNVPNNIDTTNRHLGSERNVRKNKYEPKAKKKHRIARLKFLNNKRNIEIFQMSLYAMYEHIDLLNQHYYNLQALQEERIYNIELEKQHVAKQAEIQKQLDMQNFQNTVSIMQEQLDMIPVYKQQIEDIILENKMIEEEERMATEMINLDNNKMLVDQFNLYFNEIKRKKEANNKLLSELNLQQEKEIAYKSFINNYEYSSQRYNDIYNKAISINNKIINDKHSLQNALDEWNNKINNYNEYIKTKSDIISQYREEEELQKHQQSIINFKTEFSNLNQQVLRIMRNIDTDKNKLSSLDNESKIDTPIIDDIQINNTYINNFNDALKTMKNLQQKRINQINELKVIEQQQKEMLIRKNKQQQIDDDNRIKQYKDFIEESRKYTQTLLLKQKTYLKNREIDKKHQEKIRMENQSIKLTNDINKFNNSIELYRKKRDKYVKMKKEERKNLNEEQERLLKEQERHLKEQERQKHTLNRFKQIEQSVQNVYIDQMKEISKKYQMYKKKLLIIEEQKEQEELIAKQKLQKLIDDRIKMKNKFSSLENDYNNILKTQLEQQQHDELLKKNEEDKYNELISNYNNNLNQIKLVQLQKAEAELNKLEDQIREQEILEYEKELVYTNNIQHYTNLLIANEKAHNEFKESVEKYKQLEIEKLEQIRKDELYTYNKDIVNHSIDFVLNSVNIEIETIEFNKIIQSYNKQIDKFQKSKETRENELKLLKQEKLEKEEYEKLQLELYEQQMIEYKKQQDEKLLDKMSIMITEFKINTDAHVELIKKQKTDAELADKKKRELEILNKTLIEEKIKAEFKKSVTYYNNELLLHNEQIIQYENSIINAEKELEEEKRLYNLRKKQEQEERERLELEKEQAVFKDFQKAIVEYKNNVDIIQQKKALKSEELIKERKRIELENIAERKKIQDYYINYYSKSLSISKTAYDNYIENQRLAKNKYEEEQKLLANKLEKERIEKHQFLKEKYILSLDLLEKEKLSVHEEKKLKALAQLELEEKEAQLIIEQEENKKQEYNNLLITLTDELSYIEDKYTNIKNHEKLEQKKFKEQQQLEIHNKEVEQKQNFIKLEEYYNESLTQLNTTMDQYKNELEKYNNEQLKLIKEKEFNKEEENNKKEAEYQKSIIDYNEKIQIFSNMIEKKRNDIEEINLQKKLAAEKIKEDNEKERIRLQKMVIEQYEIEINKFHNEQDKMISSLYEDLKLEKQNEFSNRIEELEKNMKNKLDNSTQDNILRKIDTTINYIKDLNDNKENEDYINQLKYQYDNSYINPDESKPVDESDILYVGENKLSYDNFSIFNKYTFNIVPKIIYQTWPTKNLTKNMAWVVNRLKSTHPDFKYHLFDDNDCRLFIKEHFGMETLWAFDRLIPGAYKADLWRYCAMYKTGGIYLDIKMCPVNGFRFDYLLKNDWYCNDIARGNGFAGIWQGILVSRPKNPIFKYLIDEVIKNVKNEYYGNDPLEITGPKMMRILLNNLRVKIDTPLQIKKYLNKKASSISKREYKVGICINDDIECLLEYDEYRQECLRTGIHYNEAWKKNQVYNQSILLENYVSDTV